MWLMQDVATSGCFLRTRHQVEMHIALAMNQTIDTVAFLVVNEALSITEVDSSTVCRYVHACLFTP